MDKLFDKKTPETGIKAWLVIIVIRNEIFYGIIRKTA
jgi:hypothetical protein